MNVRAKNICTGGQLQLCHASVFLSTFFCHSSNCTSNYVNRNTVIVGLKVHFAHKWENSDCQNICRTPSVTLKGPFQSLEKISPVDLGFGLRLQTIQIDYIWKKKAFRWKRRSIERCYRVALWEIQQCQLSRDVFCFAILILGAKIQLQFHATAPLILTVSPTTSWKHSTESLWSKPTGWVHLKGLLLNERFTILIIYLKSLVTFRAFP